VVAIRIEDGGIGVPADERDLVFEQFHRGRNVRERNVPGSGLGLAISRRLVEAHHGTIAFDPDRTRGAAVEVRLPLVPDQVAAIGIGAERTSE
jgi:signal transduction histidine kinase